MTDPADQKQDQRCGYVSIVGRPNVGKSTLMNAVIGQKVSITAPKPQTTRHQIMGVHTTDEGQIVFIDTPGIHLNPKRAINRFMNRAATALFQDVDLICWVVDATRYSAEDENLCQMLQNVERPVICVINKIDQIRNKEDLLPLASRLAEALNPAHTVMVSALKSRGTDDLAALLVRELPFSQPLFDEDTLTDRSERFLAAEFIREQLTRKLHQELPYATTVTIEEFITDGALKRITACIWVERQSQKGIVIGKQGATLKMIGSDARRELEPLLGSKIFLQLWVKVKDGWSDDERALGSFGYNESSIG